ncbi:MAG: TAXI family TRAP transporter solute-binding subunit [Dehalococcoidales bacterium]|nr:TAXI family TRAP transporter solute-binding subunit [Dehalococcoidales bacterium]
MKKFRFLSRAAAAWLAAMLVFYSAACSAPSPNTTLAPSTTAPFAWPAAVHIGATGSSGEAKTISWASVMESELGGPIVRVVNQSAWTNCYKDMAAGKMVLSQIDKSTLRDSMEAISEYASPDGGPWMASLVWVDSLASTGFMVRGDSDIFAPEDIKPGTKIAIWNDKAATMSPFLSLLAWAGISQDEITWVNTGEYDACVRAVAEGRADICMAAPVAPAVREASAGPRGIRYISLNPNNNPEGAAAFLEISTLYDFGPINAGPAEVIGTWSIISYKYLGTNINTDTELVYNMAKWLDENYDLYKDRYSSNTHMTLNDLVNAMQTVYIPAHPGLIKYLKEKGIWNNNYEARNQANITLFESYCNAYNSAMEEAVAEGIEVKSSNQEWIDFWEAWKVAQGLPPIKMHASLNQEA